MTNNNNHSGVGLPLFAQLRPIWVGGRAGYKYDVLFGDEVVVVQSLDPEHDLARALLKRGIIGIVTMLDAETHKPRTLIDIEKAAGSSVSEEDRGGLRLRKWIESPDIRSWTAEDHGSISTSTEGKLHSHAARSGPLRKPDVRRAIQAVQGAGLAIVRVELESDRIIVVTANGIDTDLPSELERWINKHARSA